MTLRLATQGTASAAFRRCTSRRTTVLLALTILTSLPASSQEHSHSDRNYTFEFTRIVDNTTQGFSSFGNFPAINNHGEVAFMATRNAVPAGIFRLHNTAEAAATIASTDDGLSLFGDDVAISPSGVVAFSATTAAGSRAIFKGDGASRTLIADSAVNGLLKINVGAPSINANGTVAFFSVLAQRGFPAAVFTGNGGTLKTVANTSAAGFVAFGNVAINASGTVVFAATLADGTRAIFTARDLPVDVVDTNHHPEIDSFGDPVINDAGTIADVAFVLPLGAPEIVTGTPRGITPRNNPADPVFGSSEHPSLNNHNAVAFAAVPFFAGDTRPTGIFLEVSGGQSLIPVVRPGDKLFGSIVDHVDLGRFALNDRFQMAFSYTLKDGRSGIAIASFDGERE